MAWPKLTPTARAEISLRLAYYLGRVSAPEYVEVIMKPLIVGDEHD